jgi:hypothetical protein
MPTDFHGLRLRARCSIHLDWRFAIAIVVVIVIVVVIIVTVFTLFILVLIIIVIVLLIVLVLVLVVVIVIVIVIVLVVLFFHGRGLFDRPSHRRVRIPHVGVASTLVQQLENPRQLSVSLLAVKFYLLCLIPTSGELKSMKTVLETSHNVK